MLDIPFSVRASATLVVAFLVVCLARAVIVATLLYNTSMREELLPRPPQPQ